LAALAGVRDLDLLDATVVPVANIQPQILAVRSVYLRGSVPCLRDYIVCEGDELARHVAGKLIYTAPLGGFALNTVVILVPPDSYRVGTVALATFDEHECEPRYRIFTVRVDVSHQLVDVY